MADTLQNIVLPSGVWVDLYDETGITVGVQIIAQNIGNTTIDLFSGASAPSEVDSYVIIERGDEAINDDGDAGAWAYCSGSAGLINVREA